MKISDKDRHLLRDLAKQVAEIADAPEQQNLRELWCKHNDLQGKRPMILAYIHDSWPEFFKLQVEDTMLRDWEWRLRHIICLGKLGTDEVITRDFSLPYLVRDKDYGLSIRMITESCDTGYKGAYRWDPPLKDVKDLKKLISGISVDFEATKAPFDVAQDIFGDILSVKLEGGFFYSMDDKVAMLRGMERFMLDMYEEPEFLHELMAFIRDELIGTFRYAETHGLLNIGEIGGVFALTSQLPAQGFDGRHVRLCDLVGCQSSQTFVGVSPQQFEEFIFKYQKPVLELFGQTFYGCCEPLHDRIEIISQLKNLRRIAVSPWADIRKSAEKIQDKYIFSWKPHPGVMASDRFDREEIEKGLRETIEITRGCHLEIIMKDVTTTNGHPERLKTWVEITREVTEENV